MFSFHTSRLTPWWRCLVFLSILPLLLPASVVAQGDDPYITQAMATMSVEEKVGQLFLVAVPGFDTNPDSEIATLINNYRIGGIVLSQKNNNFQNNDQTPNQVAQLTNNLQSIAFRASSNIGERRVRSPGLFVPLFIAVEHEGDGSPRTSIYSGTSQVPSNMAIGATWPEGTADSRGQPGHAEKIGKIVGR
jgi:beta-glucosidase-like glycosyl hydrolase